MTTIDTKALRMKILDLAMSGKLVPQDPNDEPVEALLERIKAERDILVKKKKIKPVPDSVIYKGDDNRYYEKVGDKAPVDVTDKLPFNAPNSWVWLRLGNLISVISGVSYDKSDVCQSGIRILRGGNISNHGISVYSDDVFLPASYFDAEKQIRHGDIIIVASTGSKEVIGKVGFIKGSFCETQIGAFLRIIRSNHSYLNEFIQLLFLTDYYKDHIRTSSKGSNINNVKSEYINNLFIPIPPIKEQARIILRVNSLFEILDKLDSLSQEQIAITTSIKDKILSLAIQGKLVEQCEADEPASVLLDKIREEKRALFGKKYVDSYIYKGDDNCYYEHINGKETDITAKIPYTLPNSWQWTRLQTICRDIFDIDHNMPKAVESGILFLSAKDLLDDGTINYTHNVKYIAKNDFDKLSKKGVPELGNIIYSRIGACLGKARIVTKNILFLVSYSCCTIKPLLIYTPYLRYVLDDKFVLSQAKNKTQSTGVPDLGMSEIKQFFIPLPPLEEQKRIVAKIDELFSML